MFSLYVSDPSQYNDTSQSGEHLIQSQCSICRETFRDPVYPSQCGHTFCKVCVDKAVADGTAVLMCNQEWCARERNQPIGVMSWRREKQSLPGYDDCETIAVSYNFTGGQQGVSTLFSEKGTTFVLPENSSSWACLNKNGDTFRFSHKATRRVDCVKSSELALCRIPLGDLVNH